MIIILQHFRDISIDATGKLDVILVEALNFVGVIYRKDFVKK